MLEKYASWAGEKGILKKTASILMSVFFWSCASLTHAQLNISDGQAYGSSNVVASQEIISSISHGTNNLDVFYADTSKIILDHSIQGHIHIENNFNSFELNSSTNGILTGLNAPTLSVLNGTNLTISGGSYSGAIYSGLAADQQTGIGGAFSGIKSVMISNATFTGGSVILSADNSSGPPIPGGAYAPIAIGATGLYMTNSTATFSDNNVSGGDAGTARSFSENVIANGGSALILYSSSSTISNGTFSGGNGGSATGTVGFNIEANGGHGLLTSNSTINIYGATLSGGEAGSRIFKGSSLKGLAGTGLTALDGSIISATNTTFSSGTNAPAAALRNADFYVVDSFFNDGGIYSETSAHATNHLSLINSEAHSLTLINAASGIQFITADSMAASSSIIQTGGTVRIDNLDTDGFNSISITQGAMQLNNDVIQSEEGIYTLHDINSSLQFKNLTANGTLDPNLGKFEASGSILLNETGQINLLIQTNSHSLIEANSMIFETDSTVRVLANTAGFSAGLTLIPVIETANGIYVRTRNGTFEATPSIFLAAVNLETNVVGRTQLSSLSFFNNKLSFIFNTQGLKEYWGNPDGDLGNLADELDELAPPNMMAIIDNMSADQSKATVDSTYFTPMSTFKVSMQGLHAALGQSLSRGSEFRETLQLPPGANGPQTEQQKWHAWGKYYAQFYNHTQSSESAAYTSEIHGGALGADKIFGNLLIGLSGGIGNYHTENDNNVESTIQAAHGTLYTTIGKERAYFDAGLAVSMNQIETSTAPFELNGKSDSSLISGYFGGGYDFKIDKKAIILTPEASATYTFYHQDAFTESSSIAVPRSFEAFDATSLRTSLGLNVAWLNTRATKNFNFKFETRAHWLHEFNPNPDPINFQLEDGTSDYSLTHALLDENALRFGVGLTFFNSRKKSTDHIMLRLNFDEMISEEAYSHNLSVKAIFAF